LDTELRIRTNQQKPDQGLSAAEGINKIRDVLRSAHGVVRLAGLSGVGKTRLAQALFDARVGDRSLDPGIAAYTNLADGPNPPPTAVVSELIATRKRAILVVDNCPPDLHQRLSELCRSDQSPLSVITIEYDIREDQAEGTDVFLMEAASINLTDKLIRRRFAELSPVDARRIAEFSGGNARIAIALAERIDRDEEISGLSDQELFARLFQQRHQPDQGLFVASQALSLVYSFQGEDTSDDEEAELSPLGALVGKTAQEMFRHSAELQRRGLIQRRGPWRAVLPHAIANRLAATALQNIPPSAIEECFLREGRRRMLKSFSRRLHYLNDSKEARSIVTKWLGQAGLLGNLAGLNDSDYAIFNNIAPVSPEEALLALERALLDPKEAEE
jgi:hypothetical protein